MCLVMASRPSGQVSSALTAKAWRKEWGVGQLPPGPGGSPARFTAARDALSTASTESGFLRTDTNTWSSKGAKERRCRRYFSSRSEEHTSELQSHSDLVCRLLLEKKKKKKQKQVH